MGTSTVLVAPAAHAATFDLDFNWSGLVEDNDTANAGTALDANQLDTNSGQSIDGTQYSTKLGNIGSIWESYGVTITGYDNGGTQPNWAPLGLFNSNCAPRNGTSNSGFTADCEQRIQNRSGDYKTYGDNDLATGVGNYGNVSYSTEAQGNLLIFEENKGNGVADDTASGGTFFFNIADEKHWTVEKIGIVDDAEGTITYTYRDGSQSTNTIDIEGENELQFYSPDIDNSSKAIDTIAVQFNNSGGISSLRFKEIAEANPTVPEPAAALGLIAFGALASRIKRKGHDA